MGEGDFFSVTLCHFQKSGGGGGAEALPTPPLYKGRVRKLSLLLPLEYRREMKDLVRTYFQSQCRPGTEVDGSAIDTFSAKRKCTMSREIHAIQITKNKII